MRPPSATAVDLSAPGPLGDLVAAHVERDPSACAVEHGPRAVSYGRLWEDAGAAAAAICAVTGAGEVVALSGPPSPNLIAELLGVLVTGRVVLLIDPALPSARQELMLAESGAAARARPAGDDAGSVVERLPGRDDLRPVDGPDDAAYIFFTSGTTGTPNAVLGRAGGLRHFLCWESGMVAVTPADRGALLTGLSFDVVLRDTLLPLVSGATLVIPPGATGLEPDEVCSWLEEKRVSLLHAVPTLASNWTAGVADPMGHSPRCVLFAGEPLTETVVRRWRAVFPATRRVINLYGPTETTLAKCFHDVADEPLAGVQPLGRPLPETEVLVVDDDLRSCSPGVAGQIAIRTRHASAGYSNAPAETRRRFVLLDGGDDPAFLTGDLGVRGDDGLLRFLGRGDHQVKIRGVRVEPGEVAAALMEHPGLDAAAVIAVAAPAGDVTLAGFVVPAAASAAPDAGALKAHVLARLPAAFVPSTITALARMPTTANGKLDRAALAASVPDRPAAPAAPLTDVEAAIAAIWAEVLPAGDLARDDDFFALGGHSLTAARMLSRVRRDLHVDVPLGMLFDAPTLGGFAEAVARAATRDRAP